MCKRTFGPIKRGRLGTADRKVTLQTDEGFPSEDFEPILIPATKTKWAGGDRDRYTKEHEKPDRNVRRGTAICISIVSRSGCCCPTATIATATTDDGRASERHRQWAVGWGGGRGEGRRRLEESLGLVSAERNLGESARAGRAPTRTARGRRAQTRLTLHPHTLTINPPPSLHPTTLTPLPPEHSFES